MLDHEPMYKPSEAEVLTGLHPRTIRRYCRLGFITAEILPSGHYRISESELANFKKKNRDRFCDQLQLSLF